MAKPNTPREEFYDREIAPLMEQILIKCQAAKLPMFAFFELDYHEEDEAFERVTSCLSGGEYKPHSEVIPRCYGIARPSPLIAVLTVIDNLAKNYESEDAGHLRAVATDQAIKDEQKGTT